MRKESEFIRLYNSRGEHILSILPCGVDFVHDEKCTKKHFENVDKCESEKCHRHITCYDLANPDGGTPYYCGISDKLFESFIKAGAEVFDINAEDENYE